MVVGSLGNKSPHSNRITLVLPKSENDVRLRATLGSENPTGLPVGAVSVRNDRRFFLVAGLTYREICIALYLFL